MTMPGEATAVVGRSRSVVAMLPAVVVCTLAVLPGFLTGALAGPIGRELDLTLTEIGIAAAAFFLVAGASARLCGAAVQRVGARRGLVASLVLSMVSLVGAAVAPTYAVMMAALAVGGVGNAVAQPAGNLSLADAIRPDRLGIAFGVKQSSVPVATLLAGLAVSTLAVVVGWRGCLLIAAGVALVGLVVVLATGRRSLDGSPPVPTGPTTRLPRRALALLAVGGALATASATSIGVFLVESAVWAGFSPEGAGLVAAAGSVVGLATRLLLGLRADLVPDRPQYSTMAVSLLIGALGYLMLAGGIGWLFLSGTVLGFCAGWAWTGLMHLSVVRDNRGAAASATGFVQTGLAAGAGIGPALFGAVVDASTFAVAWAAAAAATVCAAACIGAVRWLR
ncbi:MAG: hypothetical protein ABS81_02725 [Pseudonocardia sp. SCN 72-86]|nr:MAG: hypothetical protein ABS81_02725 [Pseudonocardia sp. SCN 72-86]